MTQFKKLQTKVLKTDTKVKNDAIYWRKLGLAAHICLKRFGPVDYINISPTEPFHFAVTCSARVQIYNLLSKSVHKNLNKFRDAAYGGNFRSDGRLLCAGSDEGRIKLFDVSSKSLLRVFQGHASAVHRCFFTADSTHIASFSDDKQCTLWDIPGEKPVVSYKEHSDYVRAGAVSPSPHLILSGGYDHSLCLYDTRCNEVVLRADHGSPVESVIFLPSGGIFISAGGTEVRVWDTLAGGRILSRLSQHHKTVTCLRLASDGRRLMSASLDRHVKIYDTSSYSVVHTLDYPSAILSLDVGQNDETLVAGMVDGLVTVNQKTNTEPEPSAKKKRPSYHYAAAANFFPVSGDIVVEEQKPQKMSKHDNFLRKFQYSKALDSVLRKCVTSKSSHITVGVMKELIRRGGLQASIAGRKGKSLVHILQFVISYIGNQEFTSTLIIVANTLIDLYAETKDFSPELTRLFVRLHKRVKEEEDVIDSLAQLKGVIELVLAASKVPSVSTSDTSARLLPSESASANFVVSVS